MVELMQHQLDAVNSLGNGKILWGGVGTGKTITALSYYLKREAPRDIYVITTAKKRDSLDWNKEAASLAIGTAHDATIAGVLTVDSWNNVSRYEHLEDAFFIFDEQRAVGNGAWVKSFLKISKKNRWILLSATPGDTWLDYVPVFIANGFFRNVTEFKREHVIYANFSRYPKIDRYINTDVLEKYRNMLLVEMPYKRTTERVEIKMEVGYDRELMKRLTVDRWNIYEDRPIMDAGELFRCMRRLVNTDPSRLEALREVLVENPKVIVFYNLDPELELLRTMKGEVPLAEWNGHKHQPIPDTDRWVYLVQYRSGAEGWNCIETDTIVHWSLTYSYKDWHQSKGRIDRLDTKFKVLKYVIFVSNSISDRAVWQSLGSKKNFNEGVWAFRNFGKIG